MEENDGLLSQSCGAREPISRAAPDAAPSADHCTCRYGRDFDGSEFGPCAYCEHIADEEAAHKQLVWDALRWRLTQRPGYFVNHSYEFSEVESNVVVVYLGGEKAGCGRSVLEAVDCALYLTGEHGDRVPFAALLGHWRQHYRSRWDGKSHVKPPPLRFDLTDDGVVILAQQAEASPQPTGDCTGGRTGCSLGPGTNQTPPPNLEGK
jgi:hypothetical protein